MLVLAGKETGRIRILCRIRDRTESAQWTGTTPTSPNVASLATAVPPQSMRELRRPPSNEAVRRSLRPSSTASTMWNPKGPNHFKRDPEKQLFSFYVLQRMVTEEPPPESSNRPVRNYGLYTRTGNWKNEHFFRPYLNQFPERRDPENYWTNQYLPVGVGSFWKQAQKIREQLGVLGTDSTPERQTRLEGLIRPLTGLHDGVFHGLPAVSQVRFA